MRRAQRKRMVPWLAWVALSLIGVVALPPAPALGQNGSRAVSASPPLPADHWAVVAARRAEALGLVAGYLPAQAAVPRHLVRQAIQQAAERASERAPHLRALTRDWVARFTEEFPAVAPGSPAAGPRNLGRHAGLDYAIREGVVAPGRGVFPESRTGSSPYGDGSEVRGVASVAVGLGPHLSVLAEPRIADGEVDWRGWEVRTGWRNVGLSVGRQPVGYGYAPGAGLVLSGAEAIDRIQFETLAPIRLPGLLSRLGSLSVHAFGSWLEEPRHPGSPYLWGAAGALQPHPRVTLSIHRAAILGGDSVATPLTLRTFARTFIGHNLLGFENEVVAAQLRLRLPTEAMLPLTLYGEWAAEDAAGAWRDVPGRLVGVYLPAIPGAPRVALGAEHVWLAESCCGNPPWYRHEPHAGGWVMRQRPLGHPLGGQGRQSTLYGSLDLLDARLRLDGKAYSRRRGGENLFVPGREGVSTGVELRSTLRVLGRGEAGVALFHEAGRGWVERSVSAGLRAFF